MHRERERVGWVREMIIEYYFCCKSLHCTIKLIYKLSCFIETSNLAKGNIIIITALTEQYSQLGVSWVNVELKQLKLYTVGLYTFFCNQLFGCISFTHTHTHVYTMFELGHGLLKPWFKLVYYMFSNRIMWFVHFPTIDDILFAHLGRCLVFR